MTSFEPVQCPRCETSLVSIESGVDGWCANCGAILATPKTQLNRQLSIKSLISAALGGVSLFGFLFTGIPAILFGVFALRDISAQPGQLKGKWLAYGGIVMGVLFGLLCAPFGGTLTLQVLGVVQSRVSSDKTEEIMAIADELGVIPLDRLKPSGATRNPIFKERYLTFVDEDDRKLQHLFVYERRDKALAETVNSTVKKMLERRKQPRTGDNAMVQDLQLKEGSVRVRKATRQMGEFKHEIRYCQFESGEAQLAVYWRVRDPVDDDAERRAQQFRELITSLSEKALSK